jgi:hypothetical protein
VNAQKATAALQAEAEARERLNASTDDYAATLADIEIEYRKGKAELDALAATEDVTSRLALLSVERQNKITKATEEKAATDRKAAAETQKALGEELSRLDDIAVAKQKLAGRDDLAAYLQVQADFDRKVRDAYTAAVEQGGQPARSALDQIESDRQLALKAITDQETTTERERQDKRVGILQDAQRRLIRLAYGETEEKLYLLDVQAEAERKKIREGLQSEQERADAIAALEQDLANQRGAIMDDEDKKREQARQKWLDDQRQSVRMTSIEDIGRNAMLQAAQLRFPGGGNGVQENTKRSADTLDILKSQIAGLAQSVAKQQVDINKVLNPSPIPGR